MNQSSCCVCRAEFWSALGGKGPLAADVEDDESAEQNILQSVRTSPFRKEKEKKVGAPLHSF